MITTGVDIVYIPRFQRWLTFSEKQLHSVFSPREVEELMRRPLKKAAFLASRFAIKEAFYKALCCICADIKEVQPFSFRAIARFVEIFPDVRWGCPRLSFNAGEFTMATGIELPSVHGQVSLAHDQDYAIAHVFLSRISTSFRLTAE